MFSTNRDEVGEFEANIPYSWIEMPIGLRHRFYINDNSNLFTNISYNLFNIEVGDNFYEEKFERNKVSSSGFSTGSFNRKVELNSVIGSFKYKKLFVELSHNFSKNLFDQNLRNAFSKQVQLSSTSFILGYSFK